ncbi:TetR/AcrR family transcriptional regulator [Pseudooceanicola sp. HF7]|uniref:TetR/AcrR family transcriptional regulator n=1 Tax=Pseudooceanicola sp. HF7 TaxID=2721560 RepID=UPI001431BF48|nr:TetR/AcrR family transcriptional regulator [Pseudooceanicola sp. HF7]NIZ09145.1 TetR/AcrR family transcriptional regulator [Pseudooceanicola sp. HF7]
MAESTGLKKEPKQRRSRISQAKLVAAARKLMAEHGYEGFTLQQVSSTAGVSVGSLYGRFTGKDELVHFVHNTLLEEMDAAHRALLQDPVWDELPLQDIVPRLFDGIAEILRDNAPLLRAYMIRAINDPVISEAGSRSYWQFSDGVVSLLMTRANQLSTDDAEQVFRYCVMSSYSTYGNFLGLGSTRGEINQVGWSWIKEETSRMLLAYLGAHGMQEMQN